MFWVYKCNSRGGPHQRAWGDWADVFEDNKPQPWGSTEWMRKSESERVESGDIIIAYQTDRNELVGLARVVGWKRRGQFEDLILKPLITIGVKVRPLKESDPSIAAIPAFKPGPIQTIYEISDKDAGHLLKAALKALKSNKARSQLKKVLGAVGAKKVQNAPSATVGGAPGAQGAGFGTIEENRKVEQAAINFVSKYYKKRGWLVDDVSAENRGYDLLCKRTNEELHVEVKGIAGKQPQFIITSNERRVWEQDKSFVLALVTKVLTRRPNLQLFRPEDRKKFDFRPVSYIAQLRS